MISFRTRLRASIAAATLSVALLAGGCGDDPDSFVATGGQAPGPVAAAPAGVPETINALGNATLQQSAANGVLTNDTLNGANITAFDATSANGGNVNLNQDGSFTYAPPLDFRGTDSFTYTLSNQFGQSVTTVTLNVNALGFFVDNSEPTSGSGRESDPFNNLNDALTDPDLQSGDTIFVFRGNGTAAGQAGAFTLPQGVDLIGEGTGLVLSQTIVPSGQRPVLNGSIQANGNNTISGFIIENSTTEGVEATGVSDITITDNLFQGAADDHIEFEDLSGTVTIENNTFQRAGNGVGHLSVGANNTNATYDILSNRFLDDTTSNPGEAVSFFLEGTSITNINFDGEVSSTDTVPTDSYETGLLIDVEDTTQTVLNISGSQFDFMDEEGVMLRISDNALVNGTLFNNEFSDIQNAIAVDNVSAAPVIFVLEQNMIDQMRDDGISLVNRGSLAHKANLTVQNNQLTNIADIGVFIEQRSTLAASEVVGLLLGNNVNSTMASLYAQSHGTGVLCLDVENNTVNSGISFEDTSANQSVDVEQFGTLGALNNGATVTEVNGAGNDVNSVADGTCSTP